MQLILEPHSVEDKKINMSTEADSPVKGEVISDHKKEINCDNKENDPITADTITTPEKVLNKAETDINGYSSETTKDTALLGEDTDTNKISKINVEIIDKPQEEDLTDNINSVLCENSTNVKRISNDEKESESENPNENAVPTTTSYVNVKDSSDEVSINLITQNETSSSIKEVQCAISSEPSKANVVVHETESASKVKSTSEILDTKICEEFLPEKNKDNIPKINREELTIALYDDSKTINKKTHDIASPIKDVLCNGDTNNDNDSMSIDKIKQNSPELPEDIAKSNVLISSNEDISSNSDNVTISDVKHHENVMKDEDMDKQCENSLDIDKTDKLNALVHDSILPKVELPPVVHEQLEDVSMSENLYSGVKENETLILDIENDDPIAIKLEKLLNGDGCVELLQEKLSPELNSSGQKLSTITEMVQDVTIAEITVTSAKNLEQVETDCKLLSVTKEVHDVTMSEPTVASTNHLEQVETDHKLLPVKQEVHLVKVTESTVTSANNLERVETDHKLQPVKKEAHIVKMSESTVTSANNLEDVKTDHKLLPVKKEEDIVTISESTVTSANNLEQIETDHKHSPVTEEVHDVTMSEPTVASANNLKQVETDHKLSPVTEEVLGVTMSVPTVASANNLKQVEMENNLSPVTEETHDVVMAEPIDTSANDLEQEENRVAESISNLVSENNKCSMNVDKTGDDKELIDDDKDVEFIPMDIDCVEIVDVDKEQQEDDSNNETSPNVDVNETNVVDITEPDPKPETVSNKCVTEQLPTKDDEVRDKADALTHSNAAIEILAEDVRQKVVVKPQENKDNSKILEDKLDNIPSEINKKEKSPERKETRALPVVCKLSNTLDILSDDEDESTKEAERIEAIDTPAEKQCINIDDDDDIMLIEEDSNSKEATGNDNTEVFNEKKETLTKPKNKIDLETGEKDTITTANTVEIAPKINEKNSSPVDTFDSIPQTENTSHDETSQKTPLLTQNFLKTAKKGLADMTRHELEDFCIMRIVESIVDRTNLSEIKTKIKTMAQNIDDYRKRAIMLTKQNRDLQVVLKSVQEEQKKHTNAPLQPLKITRSVGMQVLMNDRVDIRRRGPIPTQPSHIPLGRPARALQNAKPTKPSAPPAPPAPPAPIPVPRKVPVTNSPAKSLTNTPTNNTVIKTASPNPNGLRNPSPIQKGPEKRTHSRMQASSSVTVDLTDDEPPPKINNAKMVSVVPPVRLVPPQNLMAQPRPFTQPLNNPRKVYIPISGPQAQNIRPGQTLMVKNVQPGPRQRVPSMPRMQQSPIRMNKQVAQRHPAPLPDVVKQYTPPTWLALPPAPDLKLSKVENGIVISWKIDGYPEGGYETIASYQLYAYQETTAPPCTALWKKIGDVKALPLPMACTLTQFMAGFKYYFAVRAVDIRSRLGPFSLPGSILLISKLSDSS